VNVIATNRSQARSCSLAAADWPVVGNAKRVILETSRYLILYG
jgi:hypothetical protein